MATDGRNSAARDCDAATPTTATLLTPPGRGAVATVGVEGPHAVDRVATWFHPINGRHLADQPRGRVVFGRWHKRPSATDAADTPGEELVVCRTGDHSIEVHCHGGQAAAAAILRDLTASGCELQEWPAWLDGRTGDPVEQFAWRQLSKARTERTAAILLDQARGVWRRWLAEISADCDTENGLSVERRLADALLYERLGQRLTAPFRVTLAGQPNVGKSSLLNALVGYQRALVMDQPGTTRDMVTATVALDGWLVELTDTAGLRPTTDAIEREGVDRARRSTVEADLVLLVSDGTVPATAEAALPRDVTTRQNLLRVYNKADLLAGTPRADNGHWVSALDGRGLEALCRVIVERLVPRAPAAGVVVPLLPEQSASMRQALKAAGQGDFAGVKTHLSSWIGQPTATILPATMRDFDL